MCLCECVCGVYICVCVCVWEWVCESVLCECVYVCVLCVYCVCMYDWRWYAPQLYISSLCFSECKTFHTFSRIIIFLCLVTTHTIKCCKFSNNTRKFIFIASFLSLLSVLKVFLYGWSDWVDILREYLPWSDNDFDKKKIWSILFLEMAFAIVVI